MTADIGQGMELYRYRPTDTVRWHTEGKPYVYPEMSDRVRKFIIGQREQRKQRMETESVLAGR